MAMNIFCRSDVVDLEAQGPLPFGDIASTYDLIKHGALMSPSAPALSFFASVQGYDQPHVWTHAELLQQITRTANMFHERGVGRQDVIAFVLPNLPETHWVIWGAEAVGIVMAINPMIDATTMKMLLDAAGPRLIVTVSAGDDADLWDRVSGVADQVDSVEGIFSVCAQRYGERSAFGWSGQPLVTPGNKPVLDFHQALEGQEGNSLVFALPTLDDVASYFCTGGTTGAPKIAIRTHRTEVANAIQVARMLGGDFLKPQTTFLAGLPLFHVNAQILTGLAVWSQGAHVLLATAQGYRSKGVISDFWKIIQRYAVNAISGVPTIYSSLIQTPVGDADISSLQYAICGAAPMPVELFNRFTANTGVPFLEGYGMTEGGCVSSLNPAGGVSRLGSIGLRLPWQAMKIVILRDKSTFVREALPGEAGSLVICGPNLFKGYLNPADERDVWVEFADDDGQHVRWLITGDLGTLDEDGYFWLTGRSKELIIRGGHNIDPKGIEEVMARHPSVAIAAAVGRPDAYAGEVPVMYVQLRQGEQVSAGELLNYLSDNISERPALPKAVRVVEALPVTAVGKLFKPELVRREIEWVVRDEAIASGVTLATLDVLAGEGGAFLVQWSPHSGDAEALRQRLAKYTFKSGSYPA
ncbi:acyl-CoA synthetase [Pseudomonas sp. BF-R-24]|uniref:acyl-CoA synthetase n=1 Tax=Pseudomonas sp. BF-R-24 TaxID=2832386 RepID=UPI001CBC334F|nr:acyl-CoA synthetase [Pseudomonas sp. BF-R-24]